MSIVNIHIHRLVLDGIDVPENRRPLLQAAVEAELGRLFVLDAGTQTLADRYRERGNASRLSGGEFQLAPDAAKNSPRLGQQIAGAVKQGVDP